jgi:FkbM family methyltransferase
MNHDISKILRNKVFYKGWQFLNRLSLYGMNFGVASGYADYSGELHIIKNLKKHMHNGVIFDVGANVGDWSKFIIQEYKDINYNLYMFEPSASAYQKMIDSIKTTQNIKQYQIGFGDKNETIKIYFDNETQGSAGAFIQNSKYSEDIQIETIDDFCQKNDIQKISFLKMDVQGYEYNILLGAQNMLESGKIDFIQFEIDEPNIENRIFFKDFWKMLSPNYKIYHSLYNGLVEIQEYHYNLENFNCMNYLAVKK